MTNQKQLDKRPPKPEIKWEWYSICSIHREYNQICGLCQHGEWVSHNEREFNNWLWTHYPKIWQKWANRDNISGWREWFRKFKWGK